MVLVTGIILASGFSKRMSCEKLLLAVEGIPLVERVISAARNSRLHEIILVYRDSRIKEIADTYGVKTVCNAHAEEGQSAAIKEGLRAACADAEGFMFLAGDQPYVTTATINQLLDVFNVEKKSIVVPEYAGIRGNPVTFPSSLRENLLGLQGDCGGRVIIEQMADRVKPAVVADSNAGIDVDTEEDYIKIKTGVAK